MVFCGHCGYQLAPGDKVCPRCGSVTDADLIEEAPEPNSETVPTNSIQHSPASLSGLNTQRQASPPPPPARPTQLPPQEPLVLGPDGRAYPDNQFANEATSMMTSPQTYTPPYQAEQSYQGYAPQNVGSYPNYPQASGVYSNYAQPGTPGYPQYGQFGQRGAVQAAELAALSRKGRTVALLLILLGLLLLIGAMVLYLLERKGMVF